MGVILIRAARRGGLPYGEIKQTVLQRGACTPIASRIRRSSARSIDVYAATTKPKSRPRTLEKETRPRRLCASAGGACVGHHAAF
jgi:hypothetical protein